MSQRPPAKAERDRAPGALGAEPTRTSLPGRVLRILLAWPILVLAVLLPLRLRVRLAELIGAIMDWAYGSYLGLLRWLLRKLEDDRE